MAFSQSARLTLGWQALLLVVAALGCQRNPQANADDTPPATTSPAATASQRQATQRPKVGAPATATGRAATSPPQHSARQPTDWSADESWTAKERTSGARKRRLATVKRLVEQQGLSWPPRQVYLRAFKHEEEVEVWAGKGAGAPLKRIASYAICSASGVLGPKRRQGDFQVPEGYYRLSFFNSKSRFHLSLRVSYPNRADRKLGGRNPGGDIMIHGNCVSIGCLAMSDERIEELWLLSKAASEPVAIHIFPGRDWEALLADPDDAKHHTLWRQLRAGYDYFEREHKLPRVTIDRSGNYQVGKPPRR